MDLPLDGELVVRAMAGERLALDQLWRTHRRFVAAVLLAHLPRTVDLEDLLQDVAMKMVGQIHSLKSAASFLPWIRTVARNVAVSHGRKLKVRGPHASLPFEPIDPSHEHEPIREQLDEMLKIVQGMHVDYREPLWMRSVQGMSQQAIAEALDLPVTTIETRLVRARRLLRRELSNKTRQPSGGMR